MFTEPKLFSLFTCLFLSRVVSAPGPLLLWFYGGFELTVSLLLSPSLILLLLLRYGSNQPLSGLKPIVTSPVQSSPVNMSFCVCMWVGVCMCVYLSTCGVCSCVCMCVHVCQCVYAYVSMCDLCTRVSPVRLYLSHSTSNAWILAGWWPVSSRVWSLSLPPQSLHYRCYHIQLFTLVLGTLNFMTEPSSHQG